MTAEGFPETEAELQAVCRSEAFRRSAAAFRHVLREKPPDKYLIQAAMEDIRREFGPELLAGLIEWENA